jgi:transcription elongation factor Elf1
MNASLLWLEKKYVGFLANRLPLFKDKTSKSYLVNFRCVMCGDSESNKRKARGYIGEKDGKLFYYCHNCGASMTFQYFLSLQDDMLYKDFLKEKFTNDVELKSLPKPVTEPQVSYVEKFYGNDTLGPLRYLTKISQLEWNHPAKKYIYQRKIPIEYHPKLRYTPTFNKFVNSLLPERLPEKYDEGRLLIPFLDTQGHCFGFQGRSFKENGLRYITIMLTDKLSKVFGLDTVDINKRVYILEGPIDAMFIKNSVAMAGSDMSSFVVMDSVYVYDNEPRSKEICHKMENVIKRNGNICIWPEDVREKDINDMILAGKSSLDIQKTIDDNTYSGLLAQLEFNKWKKC